MGLKQSTQQRPRTYSDSQGQTSTSSQNGQPGPSSNGAAAATRTGRARSMTFGTTGFLHIPGRTESGDNDSDSSGDDPLLARLPRHIRRNLPHSLPVHLFTSLQADIKCPVCSKQVPSDDIECHLLLCLTKPRITYNEDVLMEDKEKECVICLDDLVQGDTIARLPCLCIYHKNCIDDWFKVNRSCPEHPID